MAKISKEELLRAILDDEREILEDEDILHLLISERVSKDVAAAHRESYSRGAVMADKLAKFAGSWKFIIIFLAALIGWIACNAFFLSRSFDPYPFILLNLILSCIAAIQAPVIMMSQNRQEEKDRLRSVNDYRVNLKSEVIVEDIHEKLDRLIANQQILLEKLLNEKNGQ